MRYPGAKWSMTEWILRFLPIDHATYVEPFFGTGAVFFNKPPVKSEYINDVDDRIVNLWRMVRERGAELADLLACTPWSRVEYLSAFEWTDDPLELARRTIVMHHQSFGATADARYRSGWRHNNGSAGPSTKVTRQWKSIPEKIPALMDRLQDAQIECMDAVKLIQRHNQSDTLIYVDPPYLGDTRGHKGKTGKLYRHDMQDTERHQQLLTVLGESRAMVMISHYLHPLYEEMLAGWHMEKAEFIADGGGRRTEALWLNPSAWERLQMQNEQSVLFGGPHVGL